MFPKVNIHWLLTGIGEPILSGEVGEIYQIGESRPRTLEDIEVEYKADPLAGLKEMLARLEELERWRAEVESKMSPNQE